jgi:hypothetical protein
VAELESRRKTLGLTRAMLLHRFEEALRKAGCIHTDEAVKMRLNRIFNRRMRRPLSEETQAALAAALDWSIPELESAIGVGFEGAPQIRPVNGQISGKILAQISRDLADASIRLQNIARTLQTSLRRNR